MSFKNQTILIVDDSIEMLEVLRRHLFTMEFTVFQSTNVIDAIDILKNTSIDLLITDLQMPGIHGMKLVQYATEHFPTIPILVITGYPSVSGAVQAIQSGVVDYLVKPFTQQELKSTIEKSLIKLNSNQSKEKVTETNNVLHKFGIIGNSESILQLNQLIQKIKNIKATVLIQGESGTGKELVARAIHYAGVFHNAPFIAVNCGAIPENLLESELFGYVKGAFTGANESRAGLFQAADGGSIFLDEIGNASLAIQTRLLRVLQEKEITMVGSTKAQKINVRVIAATNSDLLQQSKIGNFREDLYYRLHVISIETTPLRNRKDDIPLLSAYFIQKYAREYQSETRVIDEQAQACLNRFSWPGNIRELENVIQRSVILCNEAKISMQHLPEYIKISTPNTEQDSAPVKSLKQIEKEYILRVLEFTQHNKTKAAEILGIDRKTLRQKIEN
jgi:two-component system, NtrC family, response regulator HydG